MRSSPWRPARWRFAFFVAASHRGGPWDYRPRPFGQIIESGGTAVRVALVFLIGAAVMAVGGLVEMAWGVKAEGQQLEDIAAPLTTADDPTGRR